LNALCRDRLRRSVVWSRRPIGLFALMLVAVARAHSAPHFEDFTAVTWTQWQRVLPRPAIVVFSTTYCPTCPQVFNDLAHSVRHAGAAVPLIAVIMDIDGLARVERLEHFRLADRLFVFRGNEAALRFSVDPRWRGVTPYVALFGLRGAPTLTAGNPDAAQMRAVLGDLPK